MRRALLVFERVSDVLADKAPVFFTSCGRSARGLWITTSRLGAAPLWRRCSHSVVEHRPIDRICCTCATILSIASVLAAAAARTPPNVASLVCLHAAARQTSGRRRISFFPAGLRSSAWGDSGGAAHSMYRSFACHLSVARHQARCSSMAAPVSLLRPPDCSALILS